MGIYTHSDTYKLQLELDRDKEGNGRNGSDHEFLLLEHVPAEKHAREMTMVEEISK